VTSATAHVRPDDVSAFARARRRFRDWRHRRPFWGGVLAILAGLPILYFPYARLSLGGVSFAMSTTGGAGALIIGVLVMVLGVTAWVQPTSRVFAGIATILLVLVSIPVSNLGGFGMGLLLGLIGGGLMAAWAPLKEPAVTEQPALVPSVRSRRTESWATAPAAADPEPPAATEHAVADPVASTSQAAAPPRSKPAEAAADEPDEPGGPGAAAGEVQ
jgi:hypothetical protein